MKRFITPEENNTFALEVNAFPCVPKYSVVEICVFYKPSWAVRVEGDWIQLSLDSVCERELIPQIDERIMELLQVRKEAIKIFKDAKAGRITEEFFNNQEVDAERF